MEDSQKLGDILNAPPEHLRAVLRIFCTKNKEARDTIAEYLSVAREQNLNGLADVEFCMKCEKPYLEANNREGSCCFHDGNCVLDEDASVWADWDEELGFIDDPGNEEEYPEGFYWDCCNRRANGQGCKSRKHEPMHCLYSLRHPSHHMQGTLLSGPSVKREREEHADLRICKRCDQAFSDKNNPRDACAHHTFPLQLDVEAIAWCQPGAPAPPEDAPYYRMAYPGGFIYECCDGDGSTTGCTMGPHKAKEDKKVKGDRQ